ncbi:MAG: hypothetical protein RTV72_01165 [Candidatus Thorarchaeota archaeon]
MTEHEERIGISEINWEINLDSFAKSVCSNEKLLLLLNKETGLAPYSHEFIEGVQDPQILSGFISAISSFMREVTGKQQSQWKTVFGSDSIILVEGGEWSVGVLVAAKETTEVRSKLRSVIREFEDCFEFLRDVEGIQNIFHDFDSYVRRVFVDERVTNRTIVTKAPEWRSFLTTFNLPSIAFEVSKILLGFEESTTAQEIARFQSIRIEKVIETISRAFWNGLVSLKYIPSDDDILALSEKASTIIFGKSNPLKLSASCLSVVARLDGRTPLSQFINDMIIQDHELLLDNLGSLINNGLVQRISVEKRFVLFNECILSHLVSKGASIVGSYAMKQYFEAVGALGRSVHPWICRIVLSNEMHVACILEESMTPIDLDDMFDALEYFIEEMATHLSKKCGTLIVGRLLEKIRNECRHNWAPYLANVVI